MARAREMETSQSRELQFNGARIELNKLSRSQRLPREIVERNSSASRDEAQTMNKMQIRLGAARSSGLAGGSRPSRAHICQSSGPLTGESAR